MTKNLLAMIKSLHPSFTRVEKNIADYLLQNAQSAIYMSITELAKKCGACETSISRFCKRLGQLNFQSFKSNLAQSVSEASVMPSTSSCIVSAHDDFDTIMQKVLNSNIAVLNETYRMIDSLLLSTVVKWLSGASHICFFGVGLSAASALEAHNRFTMCCPKAEHHPDLYMQIMRASLLLPKDVAILFSYTGRTKEILSIAAAAKNAGAYTICVSRFSNSPLTKLCDLLFLCGSNEGPYQSGNFSIKTGELFLMDVLSIAYCHANPTDSSNTRTLTSNALKACRS